MVVLKVVQEGQRKFFNIINEAPDFKSRYLANAVYVCYKDIRKEGRIRTYANDRRPFGPTIRHYRNISEQFIDHLHLLVDQELYAEFSILPDGSHQYEIINIEK